MKAYLIHSIVTYNGVDVKKYCGFILSGEEKREIKQTITWNNIDEIFCREGGNLPFFLSSTRKGKKIVWDKSLFTLPRAARKKLKPLKEWKEEIELDYVVTFSEFSPSLKMLENCDAILAAKYLHI